MFETGIVEGFVGEDSKAWEEPKQHRKREVLDLAMETERVRKKDLMRLVGDEHGY